MTHDTYRRSLEFDDPRLACELFGPRNEHLAMVAEKSGVDLSSRGSALFISGKSRESAESVANLFVQLYGMLKDGDRLYPKDIEHALGVLEQEPEQDVKRLFRDAVFVASPKKSIGPKSLSQRAYVAALREHEMVLAVGPAGTGKTYLAVAMALNQLTSRQVKRIILTRPAVEAGEKLGFLPGDLVEKVNPYLRPLYDALGDMLDFKRVKEMLETGVIEVAPLAFMRGRTLNDAYIILDEAQNTTPEQMKMFLTRMGFGSRMVITGDVTQIDLPEPPGFRRGAAGARRPAEERSGLVRALRVLEDVPGVGVARFAHADVIRHPLVGRVVEAYERHEGASDAE